MSFADEQVADDQDFVSPLWGRLTGRWRKEIRIGAVVDDRAANILLQSVSQKLLHLFADANYRARGTIDVDGSPAPPLGRNSAEETRVEHIQTVQGHDKRNVQMPRQQGCRMAAGQSSMSVDEVNRSLSVEPRHLGQQASEEPKPRARQAQIAGNLRVSRPMRASRWVRLLARIVDRGYGHDAGPAPKLFKLLVCFRDEATAHFIVRGRKKWRQREDMQHRLPCLFCRRDVVL